MDPDACLKEIRELSKKMQSDYEDEDGNGIDQDDANRLAELVDALDNWLVNLGFLPREWNSSERSWSS